MRSTPKRGRPVKADAFHVKVFRRAPRNKAHACFVRRYDADHGARRPKQKVAAMKLLLSSEIPDTARIVAPLPFAMASNTGTHRRLRSKRAVDWSAHRLRRQRHRSGLSNDIFAIVRLERITVWHDGRMARRAKCWLRAPTRRFSASTGGGGGMRRSRDASALSPPLAWGGPRGLAALHCHEIAPLFGVS